MLSQLFYKLKLNTLQTEMSVLTVSNIIASSILMSYLIPNLTTRTFLLLLLPHFLVWPNVQKTEFDVLE